MGHAVLLDWQDEANWSFIEPVGVMDELYIYGGGHVSLALSRLFKWLGFRVTVFDNRRPEVNTWKDNVDADRKEIIDYDVAREYLPEGPSVYAVIMTQGHAHDGHILRQLIHKDIRYLGMMGSRKKVDSIFSELQEAGISREWLDRVDAPIGLPIDSETPMEIAVSIAARVIGIKNRKP